MKRSKLILVLVLLVGALTMAACSGSAEKDAEIIEEVVAQPTKTAPPPTPEPTATEEMVMMPVSMVSAELGGGDFNTYKLELPGGMPQDFEDSELPAPLGEVTVNWFTSGGFYVAAYYGLDLAASGPLCPGNSIQTGSGWLHVTNAPTEEGACDTFSTLTADPDVGPIDCHGVLFYRTAIPSDLQGTLWGTLEIIDADGYLVGMTSQAESTTEMLEIDLAATCQ